jgi:arylsulfatase A-like enzyme
MRESRCALAGFVLGLFCWSAETSVAAVRILRLGLTPHPVWTDTASYVLVGIGAAAAAALLVRLLPVSASRKYLLVVGLALSGLVSLQVATWYFIAYNPAKATLLPLNSYGALMLALILCASLVVGLAAAYLYQLACHYLGGLRCGLAVLALSLLPLGLAAVSAPASPTEAPATATPGGLPNLVIISLDTLRADRLGCYGHPGGLSTNIDRLASEALLFANCYSQSSWTLPSFCSLFSGLDPAEHGAGWQVGEFQATGLKPEVVSLAERLSQAGYTCSSFQANPNMIPLYGVTKGYQPYLGPSELRLYGPPLLRVLWTRLRHHRVGQKLEGSLVTQAARSWLADCPQPFFAWLNLMEMHTPYYTDSGEGFNTAPLRVRGALATKAELAKALHSYEGALRKADRLVGAFTTWLREHYPNTILIITSDHGEEFADHGGRPRGWESIYDGGFGHGHTLYQELLHVPLIIHLPAPTRAKVIRTRVRLKDLYPTVLDMLGLPETKGSGAASLLPLLEAESADRPVLSESIRWGSQKRALVTGNLKYIEHEASGRCELYDIAQDPLEQHDLAAAQAPEVERLKAALHKLPHYTAANAGPVVKPPTELERELKDLGYVN